MFRRSLLLAMVPALLFGAAPARSSDAPDFSADRFRSHVTFLADDTLKGREAGSEGYEIAANYVAAELMGLGLQPGGAAGSWFQQVPLRSYKLSDTPPSITISGPSGSRSWENRTQLLMGPSALEQEQDISAPVVFAGYGLEAPAHGIDDYRGLDVRGKVVALLSGAPADVPSELAAHLNSEKFTVAARHGAIGVITIDTPASAKAVPWELRLRYAGGTGMTWVGPDGQPFDESPGLRFSARLHDEAAAALFEGAPRNLAAVRSQSERKKARPKGFPLKTEVRVTRTSLWDDATSPNVVGVLPGSDPALRDEYVVLMGHLDHIGLKQDAKPGEDAINNGAIDNAAGIATMLEVARAFATAEEKPRRSIIVLAVTAEEKGLIGSDYFAHHPTVPVEHIAASVNLDMPLLLYDFTDVVAFGSEHSTLAEPVSRAANAIGVALSPDPMPEQNVFVRSDHYSLVRQGVPSVMIDTGYANGGEEVWKGFLTGNYHNVGDEIGQPIRWDSGARFARLNYLIARAIADADQRPLWYEDNFFGETFAPEAPKAERGDRG